MTPLLHYTNAVIYGAKDTLAGCTVAGPEEVAGEIRAAGGLAVAARLDAFDGSRGEESTRA